MGFLFGTIYKIGTSVITGNSGVWGLKKNFALLELLEKLQESQENEAVASWLSKEVLLKERLVSQTMQFLDNDII